MIHEECSDSVIHAFKAIIDDGICSYPQTNSSDVINHVWGVVNKGQFCGSARTVQNSRSIDMKCKKGRAYFDAATGLQALILNCGAFNGDLTKWMQYNRYIQQLNLPIWVKLLYHFFYCHSSCCFGYIIMLWC